MTQHNFYTFSLLYLKVQSICICPLPQSACNLHLSSTSKCTQPALVLHLKVHADNWPAGDDDDVVGDLGHVLDAHVHQAAQNGLYHKQKDQTSKTGRRETVWTLLVKRYNPLVSHHDCGNKSKMGCTTKEPGMKNSTAPNSLKSPCERQTSSLSPHNCSILQTVKPSKRPSFTRLTVQIPLLE